MEDEESENRVLWLNFFVRYRIILLNPKLFYSLALSLPVKLI